MRKFLDSDHDFDLAMTTFKEAYRLAETAVDRGALDALRTDLREISLSAIGSGAFGAVCVHEVLPYFVPVREEIRRLGIDGTGLVGVDELRAAGFIPRSTRLDDVCDDVLTRDPHRTVWVHRSRGSSGHNHLSFRAFLDIERMAEMTEEDYHTVAFDLRIAELRFDFQALFGRTGSLGEYRETGSSAHEWMRQVLQHEYVPSRMSSARTFTKGLQHIGALIEGCVRAAMRR